MPNPQPRVLMICSSFVMLALGVLLTFAPQEVLTWGGSLPQPFSTLLAEASGALYLGFAMLNWMAKDNLIGGIYSRPVAIGNFAHYFILAATLFRLVFAGPLPAILWAVAIVYGIFASWFGWVLFTSPQLRAASRTMRTS